MNPTLLLVVALSAVAGLAEAGPASPAATDHDRVPQDSASIDSDAWGPPGSDPCRPNCLDWARR